MNGIQPNRRWRVVYLTILALSLAGVASTARARTQDIPQNLPDPVSQDTSQEKDKKDEKKDDKKDEEKVCL